MAERFRSKHGGRDTDQLLGEDGEPTDGGSAGGDLARKIGARDQIKRTFERPAGATRPTGEDEAEDGGKE